MSKKKTVPTFAMASEAKKQIKDLLATAGLEAQCVTALGDQGPRVDVKVKPHEYGKVQKLLQGWGGSVTVNLHRDEK